MQTNPVLTRIIITAVDSARRDGLDYLGQTERAMRVVRMVEPDLAPGTARRMVETLRHN
jgi:hypothetical protein